MADPKFGYLVVETVDGTVSALISKLIVSNGTLQLAGAESAEVTTGGGGGAVTSVFGRTGAVVAAANDYTWAQINKAASSLADLATRSAGDLSSGMLLAARMPALTGDVTTAAGSVATTIANDAVTLAKLADVATASFLGRNTVGTGDPEVLSIATVKTMLALTGTNTGDVTLSGENYLSLVGQALTANQINLAGTHVTGTLPVTKGGTGTAIQFTAGAVVFADASGVYSQNNANLFWDNSNARLGIGTASPGQRLEVAGNIFVNNATATLYLKDTSTGFQAAATTVITPQNNNAIRSTNYTSGLVGWNISAVGNAEFNNVDIRGAIHASIFTYNTIAATAGTLGVFKASGKLRTLTSTPVTPSYGVSTINVEIEDIEGLSHAASQIFAVNDILRLKDPLAGDVWLRVLSVSDQVTFWRYVSTVMAGTANAVFNPGLGVPNYGPANTGFIIQTADQTNAPYMQMATHPATFTSQDANGTLNVTPRLRIGNLNGSYGFATDIYGFGTGQYGVASQNWLTVDDTNGIRIGNNTTVNGQWSTDGEIIVGPVGVNLNNIRLSATVGFQLRTNTTAMIAMGFAGDIRVGQVAVGQANILIISGQLDIRNNATSRIRLAADGSGFLANSSISWDTSGNLTVVGNATIAGWSISATKISSTGIDINSGASAGLAFGTTPPTSASVGTGIWLDRTGLYGLASGVVQAKVDAATGKITAGAGGVTLDSDGARLRTTATATGGDPEFLTTNSVKFQDGTTNFMALYSVASTNKAKNILALRTFEVSSLSASVEIDAHAPTGQISEIRLGTFINSVAQMQLLVRAAKVEITGVGAFMIPSITTTQKNALTAENGMIVYDSTLGKFQGRAAGVWVDLH